MLRIFSILLGFALTIICFSNLVYSQNVPNVEEDLKISHTLARESICDITITQINRILGTGNHPLGVIDVKNNTRDGFMLTLHTKYGFLKPNGSDDGEVGISYEFQAIVNSESSPGNEDGYQTISIPKVPPTEATRILGLAAIASGNGLLSEPTNVNFELEVQVADANKFKKMAGTYTDTVTISYTDF